MTDLPSPAASARLSWPDQVKGVGIVLVVFGHVWRGLNAAGLLAGGAVFETVDRAIYLFHMPLFFFVSGLFFAGTLRRGGGVSFGSFLRGRVLQILWPLALWTWIYFAFKGLAGGLANHPADWAEFPLWPLPPREQFWFLWALFLVQILAWLGLHPLVRRAGLSKGGLGKSGLAQGWLALALLVALALAPLPFGRFFPAEWVGPACHYAAHFALGMLLARPLLAEGGPRVSPWLACGLFVLALALGLRMAPDAVGDLVPAAGAVLGLVLALRAAPVLGWTAPLGRASMAIYVAHVPFLAALRIVLVKAGVTGSGLHLGLGTAIGLAGPLVLLWGLRRAGLAGAMGLPAGS